MKCFYCGHPKTIVLDSRGRENFSKVMRKRCCPKCKKRTTTFERTEEQHFGCYENLKKNYANKLSYSVCYKSILKQLKLLEEAINLIHPDNYIDSDIQIK